MRMAKSRRLAGKKNRSSDNSENRKTFKSLTNKTSDSTGDGYGFWYMQTLPFSIF